MLVFAKNGVFGKVLEGVIHPTHVPFQAEAEAAEIGWTRDAGPGGGFFGNGKNSGETEVGDFVHPFDEIDSFEIFATAETVGDPFTLFPRIIEVKHGSDCVHSETINVIFVEPEKSVRD